MSKTLGLGTSFVPRQITKKNLKEDLIRESKATSRAIRLAIYFNGLDRDEEYTVPSPDYEAKESEAHVEKFLEIFEDNIKTITQSLYLIDDETLVEDAKEQSYIHITTEK